ncbi:MAG: exodeoxyribonuclease V subunit gamma [Candidatus Omnitrophica bacterium]|nr:exodeoxyribonuclease V subunit gamma [Candidatus Omnitrophota bacterium]
MSKILLIGPSGSGKTYQLLNQFEQSLHQSEDPLNPDSFFILPSAEHTERITSLILQRGIKGFFYQRITTLPNLMAQTFGQVRQQTAQNVTRFLIVKEILEQQNHGYFEEIKASSGFLNAVLSFLSELKESLISEDFFRQRMNELKRLEPEFAVKYESLAGLYQEYQVRLKQKGLIDRQDVLEVYRQRKEKGVLPPQTHIRKIWMDGFFDFSDLQLAYIHELSQLCDEMTITLTFEKDPRREALFEGIKRTEQVLNEMGFQTQELKRAQVTRKDGLAFAEKNLFIHPKPAERPKPDLSLGVFEAIGMEGEIEMIARSILKLYGSQGYRFSDFAVLLRQIGNYDGIIRSIFRRYGIPVEIHERERLYFSPMIRTLSYLLAIFKNGWQREDLLQFLKSSYVRRIAGKPKSHEWVGTLEHQSMKKGIFAGRQIWLESWNEGSKTAFDDEKERCLQALGALEDALLKAGDFRTLKKRILDAVKNFGLFTAEDETGEHVRRDAAAFKRLCVILDEIESSLRKTTHAFVPRQEKLFEIFTDRFMRLAELDLYSLHERDKNRVQVYDVSLARQKEYRVVYLAGMVEKKFPVQMREDPLLSDWERRLFNADRMTQILREYLPRQSIERYLFYLAVTRAREFLIMTYPRLDLEGKETLPSYYVEEIRSLFEGSLYQREQKLGKPYPDLDDAVNDRELELALIGDLRRPVKDENLQQDLIFYLLNKILAEPPRAVRIRRAFYRVSDALSDSRIAGRDAFRACKTSASRLEEYGKCAFKYFSSNVLELNDPEQDENITLRGIILHEVLENFFALARRRPSLLKKIEDARQNVTEELEKTLRKYPLIIEKRFRYELEKEDLKETLMRFLDFELPRLGGAAFTPRYFEFDFGGSHNPDSPPLEIDCAGETIRIRGKIDRIDVDSSGKLAAVLDYKRKAQFKKPALELGVALQLPIYALVAEKHLNLKAVSAELYSLKELEKKGFYRKAWQEMLGAMSSRRMLLSDEEFEAVLERAVFFIRKYSSEMKGMNISVKPRLCESFCPYSAVCRIEKWRLPVILEEIKEKDRFELEKQTTD